MGEEIDAVFEADDAATFREVAADLGMNAPQKGRVFLESRSMDADYFEADLKQVGQKIREKYVELGHGKVRVSLQIDSAGGHDMARGDRVFSSLAAMMGANSILSSFDSLVTHACSVFWT